MLRNKSGRKKTTTYHATDFKKLPDIVEKNLQKLIKFTQEMEEKQTTFEKLNDMFEWRKGQLKTYKESAKDDIEKTFYIGAMHEAERLQNVLKHMCWTGEITIKFNI